MWAGVLATCVCSQKAGLPHSRSRTKEQGGGGLAKEKEVNDKKEDKKTKAKAEENKDENQSENGETKTNEVCVDTPHAHTETYT
uniref:Uncharacterized protein n=1 Tax=Pygocentrus nattereri TaxID=42514 RepID=A0AAR2IJU0_PYGNA